MAVQRATYQSKAGWDVFVTQESKTVASSWENVKVDGRDMDMYVSVPGGSGPFPAVVVGQHAAVIDRFIRDMADRLAAEGYATVTPNLFHRITEDMVADGSSNIQHLSDSLILADINAAVEFLRNHASVDGERIGVTGFCLGGRAAWLAAAVAPRFKAAVPYCGGDIMVPWGSATQTPFDLSGGINCPILFHFGEADENPSQVDMRKLDAELTRLGKPHQFYAYPGAGHAFMDHTAVRFNKEASQVSWFRTLDFFAEHLKGP